MERLVGRARGGDREAFGRLVRREWPRLVGLARVVLAGDLEAEDAVQEALIRAWSRLSDLRRPASFPGWVRSIVYRECVRRARRRRPQQPLDDGAAAPLAPNQMTGDVERALARLSPQQRAVIYLGGVEGLTDGEIAELLGLRGATIRVHRLRARTRLREIFGET